jgi:Fe-S-cluster containining protein
MKQPGPTLSDEERQSFLRSIENVQRAAAGRLAAQASQAAIIAFVGNLQRGVDQVVEACASRGVQLACKGGCHHCCSARVEAFPPEIFRIVQHILQWPRELVDALMERLREHAATPGEGLPWKQRDPCPFLEDGLCSIYEVRPSTCRKAHSLDVESCKAGSEEIPQDLALLLAADALMMGTSNAYQEQGFKSSGHGLGPAVLLALRDQTAEARWYKGEPVFEP